MTTFWTEERDREMLDLAQRGMRQEEIAKRMGTSKEAVRYRMQIVGPLQPDREKRQRKKLKIDYSGENDPVAERPESQWRKGCYPRVPNPGGVPISEIMGELTSSIE